MKNTLGYDVPTTILIMLQGNNMKFLQTEKVAPHNPAGLALTRSAERVVSRGDAGYAISGGSILIVAILLSRIISSSFFMRRTVLDALPAYTSN